jgi:hypothetical protein
MQIHKDDVSTLHTFLDLDMLPVICITIFRNVTATVTNQNFIHKPIKS